MTPETLSIAEQFVLAAARKSSEEARAPPTLHTIAMRYEQVCESNF